MRTCIIVSCLLLAGCGGTASAPSPSQPKNIAVEVAQSPKEAPKEPERVALATEPEKQPAGKPKRWEPKPNEPSPQLAPVPSDDLPDLRTRKTGSDWPTFLGPTGNSVSTEKGIVAPWPKEGLRLVWVQRMGLGYVMPAISKGRAFVFDRVGDKMRLRCMKSETAEPLWTFEYSTDYKDLYGYDGGPRSTPQVDGGRVYIHGPEGMLHCLAAADGKPIWRVNTTQKFGVQQNFFGVGSTPVVEGTLLIVQVGGSPRDSKDVQSGDVTSNGTGIVAFDKYSGKVKYWVTDELASYAGPTLATIRGRRWCFVLAREGLVGFEPTSGQVDFHYPWRAKVLESVNASNPVVVGDRVFISETYGPGSSLLRVKPGGYDVMWSDENKDRNKSMQCHWNTPIHHEGYLYGCSGRHESNAELRCIELATGKVMWTNKSFTRSSLLMVDGHFVCLTEDGKVLLLKVNPKKYEEVSRIERLFHPNVYASLATVPAAYAQSPGALRAMLFYTNVFYEYPFLLENPCWAAPVVSNGLLYVRGKHYLACMELIPQKR
jgi:outer membrane protein assembly factor BamB